MAESFFQQLTPTIATDSGLSARFLGTEATSGPWSDAFMHAGPPSALVGHLVQTAINSDIGLPAEGFLSRFSADILRPIPVGPLRLTLRILRPGKKIGLVQVELTNDDGPLLSARCWVSRRRQVAVPPTPSQPAPAPGTVVIPDRWGGGYLRAVEWSWVDGLFHEPGPATVWTRALLPLLADTPWGPVERVLLIADSGNGISAVADPGAVTFVNTDLTVHLLREPGDEHVWMSARTVLDEQGVGLATSVLGDTGGSLGVGAQSLFVDPVQ